MVDIQAAAKELVRLILTEWTGKASYPVMERTAENAIIAARAEALEKAAEIARKGEHCRHVYHVQGFCACWELANKFESLTSQPPQPQEAPESLPHARP